MKNVTPVFVPRSAAEKLPVFGVELEILVSREQTAGASATYLATCPPGLGAPEHTHAAMDESVYVLEGRFAFVCEGVAHSLGAGDFLFVPRGARHGFANAGNSTGRVLVSSTPGGHETFFRECAEAGRAGTFTPELGAEICARHGIVLHGSR